jgi:hypothetical protein
MTAAAPKRMREHHSPPLSASVAPAKFVGKLDQAIILDSFGGFS